MALPPKWLTYRALAEKVRPQGRPVWGGGGDGSGTQPSPPLK
jgi:hypothetical protein